MYRPDDDIDHISREAAARYQAPGSPAWDALQQTLDKELPQEKEKKRRGFLFFLFLGIGLLLAGSAIWFGIRHMTPAPSVSRLAKQKTLVQNDNTVPNSLITIDKKDIGHTSPIITPKGTISPGSIAKNTRTQAAAKTTAVRNPIALSSAPHHSILSKKIYYMVPAAPVAGRINNPKAAGNNLQQPRTGKLNEDNFAHNRSNNNRWGNRHKNTSARLTKFKSSKTVTSDSNMPEADIDEVSPLPLLAESQLKPAERKTFNGKTTPPSPIAATDTASEKKAAAIVKNKLKRSHAILIGVTAGADMSTVKFKYGSDAGYNIGATGGYQFSKHWSAYTGLVYTKKNYKLKGSDFSPPKHYWTQYVNLETVAGYCRMWELPLLVRYTFNPSSATAFFASTGLSSYFMKKQAYDYAYKTNMGMAGAGNFTSDSTYSHVFSVLDLSAGFQKQIGKHLNWQVEPYIKIPLGGVGFGNIRLSSVGINVTLQYRKSL